MRAIVIGGFFLMVAAAVAAGYYGVAAEVATIFKAVALALIGMTVAGFFMGGVRVSDARPDRRRLPPKIRAVVQPR